jgi:hypothetical protein
MRNLATEKKASSLEIALWPNRQLKKFHNPPQFPDIFDQLFGGALLPTLPF